MILEVSRGHIKVKIEERLATIPGEMFFPNSGKMGFVLYIDMLTHWEAPNQNDFLREEDKAVIISEIEKEFFAGGHELVIERD